MTVPLLFRYVSARFALALGLFWAGMTLLWFVIDATLRLEGLLSAGADVIVEYYAHQVPVTLPLILPGAVLLGSVFTLTQLARGNELVPMMVGGVSLRRLSLPFFAAALGAAGLLGWMGLKVVPAAWREASRVREEIEGDTKRYGLVRQSPAGHSLAAAVYVHDQRLLKDATFVLVDARGRRVREIHCRRAVWDRGRGAWVAYEGTIYPLENGTWKVERTPEGGMRRAQIPIGKEGVLVDPGLRPADLLSKGLLGRPLSLAEAIRLSRERPDVAAFRLEVYEKFFDPLAALVLLLFGLPIGIRVSASGSLPAALGMGVGVLVLFFAIKIPLHELAVKGIIPPLAAPVIPPAAFGLPGLALFLRIRT